MTVSAHAGVMDYLFNAVKDLTTPVEPVTPAEETKTPIAHPAPEIPEPAHTLVFDIRDAKSGEVISEATCAYRYSDTEGANPKGSITFKDKPELALPAGITGIGLSVWAPGCAAKSLELDLKSKPERINVPVRLEKGGTADGIVVNVEGQPVEGALVEVRANLPKHGFALLGEPVTDAQGHWAVENVPPDTVNVTVRVAHSAYVPSCKMDRVWGGQTSFSQWHNVAVKLSHGLPVSGRVVDQQGNPVAGAHLYLDNLYDDPPFTIRADGDMDGRFRLEHCPSRQATVIASASGFAPNAVSLDIVSDMPETVIPLSPARPVSFLLVDAQAVPLANARVYGGASRGDLQLYSAAKGARTDAQGCLALTDAPRDASYFLGIPGWGFARNVSVGQSDEPVKVALPAAGCVVLRAVDASTGKATQCFDVLEQNEYPGTGNAQQPWHGTGKEEDGEFTRQNQDSNIKARYRIDTPGYRQGTTRWIEAEPAGIQITLSLRPAPMREGQVFDERGNAAPMPVVSWMEGPYFSVVNNAIWTGPRPVQGDSRGVFSITSRDWEKGVLLVTTDSGAALFSGVDFESVPRIHLKPWSRVVCDMPSTPGIEASLFGVITERSRVQMSYTCTLDGKGHGVFDKVMPGQYSLLRTDPAKNMGRDRAPVGNVTAVPGQSVLVSVEAGRKVVLRVAVPDEAKPWLDKRSDGMAFELQAATGAADASRSERHTVWVHPDASGRAEMDELAPGAYTLKAEPLFDPGLPGGSAIKRYFTSEEVRFAVRPSKPGDDAPVDLGILEMHAEGEAATPSVAEAPQPGFIVDKPEGGTLSLQDLRGRYVLIDFWAVWCKLCLAQEPHLKKIWQDFGKRDDFVMLGLCLGDDPKLIREFVSSHEIPWPQGMLADGFSNVVAEHYGVASLPHILLIGPDGKTVADNLLDDKIESAVRAALDSARS